MMKSGKEVLRGMNKVRVEGVTIEEEVHDQIAETAIGRSIITAAGGDRVAQAIHEAVVAVTREDAREVIVVERGSRMKGEMTIEEMIGEIGGIRGRGHPISKAY